jgi:hypothetical protein
VLGSLSASLGGCSACAIKSRYYSVLSERFYPPDGSSAFTILDANGTEQSRIDHIVKLAFAAFHSGVVVISAVYIQQIESAVWTFYFSEFELLGSGTGLRQSFL